MAWVTYKKYRKNAATRNLPFEITLDEFLHLTGQPCGYCGDAPKTETFRLGSNGAYIYNGIDRVDNKIGYVTGNLVPCCKQCNFWKGTMPVEQFLERCRRIAALSAPSLDVVA